MRNNIIGAVVCLLIATVSRGERLPVEHFAQQEEYFGMQLSPDGRTVAYIHKAEGKHAIVMRDLDLEKNAIIEIPKSDVPWEPQDARMGWVNSHRLIFGAGSWGFAAIESDTSHFTGLAGKMGAEDQGTQYGLSPDIA